VAQIHRKIAEVNRVIYNFDLDKPLRGDFVRYEGEANSFGWHPDDDFMHERTPFRKLTGAVQLSRPEDYDGGVFEMRDEFGVEALPRGRGFLTVFPSFISHRVTPVTRGVRYSLVACAAGPRWR
jgi:PKHD-type hydroxylase